MAEVGGEGEFTVECVDEKTCGALLVMWKVDGVDVDGGRVRQMEREGVGIEEME